MENPRLTYAASLRARPALLVRSSSRRITIMRFRPANIRVINRRDSRLGHHRCCILSNVKKLRKNALMNNVLVDQPAGLTGSFHIRLGQRPQLFLDHQRIAYPMLRDLVAHENVDAP
jgi:hypothetical protein